MSKFQIHTNLNVALSRFRDNPGGRQLQLQGFADTVSAAMGRKSPHISLENSKNKFMKFRKDAGHGMELSISTGYVDAVLKWEDEVADNGVAAIFGSIIRAIGKEFGVNFATTSNYVKQEFFKAWPNAAGFTDGGDQKDPELSRLVDQIGSNIAGFVSSRKDVAGLLEELPGLGDAVAASFITNALPDAELFNPDGFSHENLHRRWGVIWSALVMEMMGQGTEDSLYPDEKTADLIRSVASELTTTTAPHLTAMKLAPLFLKEGEDQPDTSQTTAPTKEEKDEEVSNNFVKSELAPEHIVVGGQQSPEAQNLDIEFKISQPFIGKLVTTSGIEQELKDALTDFRMDTTTGQFSGDLRQPSRILTDQRIFSRRRKVVNPVSATVIICVDLSGSMRGTRINSAIQIHDALCYALNGMDIRVFSCGYHEKSSGGWNSQSFETVTPMNKPGHPITSAEGSMDVSGGGNGDDAALKWASDILLDEDTERQITVFLADGQFTNSTVGRFHERVKGYDVNVFHVDYVNSPVSPFGGKSIQAGGKSLREIAEPLARGIAEVLELD